jgi:hypothetical protein
VWNINWILRRYSQFTVLFLKHSPEELCSEGVIVSKHNLKCDCITALCPYLYQPHLSSTNLLWRKITLNPWALLCCSQQQLPFSEQLFPFSGSAARFNNQVSNLALRYSADSNCTCFVDICCQGVIFCHGHSLAAALRPAFPIPARIVSACVRACVCVSHFSIYCRPITSTRSISWGVKAAGA